MLRIKRLHTFILQTYLPMFFMTFFICLFILLMQFLWKRIDELVGKGLGVDVIAELFFYAAITFVPMALPLAILLASLMTFGNLGEHSELTAMKASGVSLLKVMQPLIVFLAFISVGAFFFQNEVLPRAQVKMWTIVFSVRQKSPDLEIPEGTFYDQIPGYNVFVKNKNRVTGTLHDMMIYDVSKGYGYANIIVADSGKMGLTPDKTHLELHLYSGESFEDMRDSRSMSRSDEGKLYRRESFSNKDVLIPFDANFNKLDENAMKSQYIGKNITELQHTIDSVGARLDSVGNSMMELFRSQQVVGVPQVRYEYNDTLRVAKPIELPALDKPMNIDSMYNAMTADKQVELVNMAISKAAQRQQDFMFRAVEVIDDANTIRRHKIEMLKKYTLSLACLIFFFIGAPLGAIIRKGGLGTPIVISVLLFIVYYFIDTFGYKQARDGRMDVWAGIWLSSMVLMPLGVFLTYKSMNDSAVFNADAYRNFIRRLRGIQEVRKLEMKVSLVDVEPEIAINRLENLSEMVESFLRRYKSRQFYLNYLCKGYDKAMISDIITELESVVEYLSNTRSQLVLNKTMDLPIIKQSLLFSPCTKSWIGLTLAIVFPIGLPLYLAGTSSQKSLKADLNTTKIVCNQLIDLLREGK